MTRVIVVDQGIGPDLTALVLATRGPGDRVVVLDHHVFDAAEEMGKIKNEIIEAQMARVPSFPAPLPRRRYRPSKGWRRHVRRRKAAGLWP